MGGAATERSAATRARGRRSRWAAVHRWLGLTAGALLVLIGLTGSLLVFHLEIDEWLNPELLRVTPLPGGEARYLPFDELEQAARRALPPGGRITFAQYPRNDEVALRFNALVPPPAPPDAPPRHLSASDQAQYHIGVNPYTGAITGVRLARPAGWAGAIPRTFVGCIFALHYALLLPRFGKPPFGDTVVAILGLLLIGSVVAGTVLWWPRRGQWKQALTVKYPAHPRRLHFDLHKTIGISYFVILVAVFLSGVYLNLRAPFHSVVRLFSPTVDRYEVQSPPMPNGVTMTMGEVLREVREQFPTGRPEWVYFPRKGTGTYTVCQRDVPDISAVLTRRCIVFDQYRGHVLHVQSPERATAGEHFIQWQWPIHSGQMFGEPGRWIVFVSGLVCPLLFVTGTYLWWRKRRPRPSGLDGGVSRAG
ncbi:MAG: PepSY-associated TM helix domain-containing protein [Nitrospiraceae bacterium]